MARLNRAMTFLLGELLSAPFHLPALLECPPERHKMTAVRTVGDKVTYSGFPGS